MSELRIQVRRTWAAALEMNKDKGFYRAKVAANEAVIKYVVEAPEEFFGGK